MICGAGLPGDRALALDGDPVDVVALVEEPSFSGCMIAVRPLGMLDMLDQNEPDQKLLAVPDRNPRFDVWHTIDHVLPHVLREIEHFFTIYKELEGKKTEIRGWRGVNEAREAVRAGCERYLGKHRAR